MWMLPTSPDILFVVSRTDTAFVINMKGKLLFTVKTEKPDVFFVSGCISPHVSFVVIANL